MTRSFSLLFACLLAVLAVFALLSAPVLAAPVAAPGYSAPPRAAGLRFATSPSRPGVFLPVPGVAREGGSSAPAGRPDTRALPGFNAPNAVIRDGDRLYVSQYQSLSMGYLTMVDITVPGAEFVTGTITAPVNGVDMSIVDGRLYVTDQWHRAVYDRDLAGGAWGVIPVRENTSDSWEYGDVLFPYGRKLFVVHQWEDLVDVVDLDTRTVEHTFTDLASLPSRVAFVGDYVVIMGVGLDAPDCGATGPNFAVYSLSDYHRVLLRDIHGDCPMALAVRNDRLYVVFRRGIREYDSETGQQLRFLSLPGSEIGWHAASTGRELVVQEVWLGQALVVDYDLNAIQAHYDLLAHVPPFWTPPVEEMVAMPALSDGRVFITNRDDNVLSIVDLPTGVAARLLLPGIARWLP